MIKNMYFGRQFPSKQKEKDRSQGQRMEGWREVKRGGAGGAWGAAGGGGSSFCDRGPKVLSFFLKVYRPLHQAD